MQNKLFGTQYDPTVHDPPLMIASPKNCESTSQPMKDAPAHMQNTAVTTTKMLRAQSWLRFCSWDCGLPSDRQGCGLGLDVSVSRRIPTSRLEKNCQRLGLGRQTSRSRPGLGHLRLVPKTNFRPNCAGHSKQCERALDVVSLCCSYYCSSY